MANNTGIKYGGRKKGTPNRLTSELRIILKDVLYKQLESIEEDLNNLEAQQRVDLIIKLMPYVFPKIQVTSHTINEPIVWDEI